MEEQARAAAAAMWDGADYDRMAERLAPAATELTAALAAAPVGRVLDLAAGTGSLAAAVAATGRPVEAVDIAPGLVATGRSRTEGRGLDVTWRVAEMDDLDPDAQYAAVASSFGIIFSPDPVATLRRVYDALVPGGMVALAVWDPAGYIAGMSSAMADVLPEPGSTAARAWIPWGEEQTVRAWTGAAGLVDVSLERRALPWRFEDVEEAVSFLFEVSPGHVAATRFSGLGSELRAAVRAHLLTFGGLVDATDPVDLEASYLVVTARRRAT